MSRALGSFSYYKLTKLQVDGAQERSSRQSEASQLIARKTAVYEDWTQRVWGAPTSADDVSLFTEVIRDVFEGRELSPFMVERLAKLCRAEYRADKATEESKFAQNLPTQEKQQLRQSLQNEEESTIQMIHDLQRAIRDAKRRMELDRYNKIQDLRAGLVAKKQALHDILQQKANPTTTAPNPTPKRRSKTTKEAPPRATPSPTPAANTSSDWIEIDDEDYFQPSSQQTATNNSDWVLCS